MSDEWHTNAQICALAARCVGGRFTLDPFGHPDAPITAYCKEIFTAEDDGFALQWRGRIWINPPFSRSDAAWRAAEQEIDAGRVRELVGIWPESPGAGYWAGIFARCHVTFAGRLPHQDPRGELREAPRGNVALVGYGMSFERWRQVFGGLGPTLARGLVRLPRATDQASIELLDDEANAAEVARRHGLTPAHARQLRMRMRRWTAA
ncbi:MAG: DNA N-6-adenine-methyltransferase [Nannocystaceae bacterium]